MIHQLYINGINADVSESIPFPISFSIADFKDPENRKRSSSRAINLEGTLANKSIFASAYNMSLTDLNGDGVGFDFDPTIRVSAKYVKNGRTIFEGLCQLLEVEIEGDHYTFKIVLFSNFVNVFQEWGDLTVGELGWDEYDHTLSATNITNSWDSSVKVNGTSTPNYALGKPLGFGYWYPLIDFGYNDPNTINIVDLVPYIYKREIIEKAFALANLTIDSDFIDSDMFRALVFGFGGGKKEMLPPADLANRQVEYSFDDSKNYVYPFTASTSVITDYNLDKKRLISEYTDTLLNDGYNQFDNATGKIRVFNSGKYRLNIDCDILIDGDFTTIPASQSGNGYFFFAILKNGVQIAKTTEQVIPIVSSNYTISENFDIDVNTSDVIEVKIATRGTIRAGLINPSVNYELNIDLQNDFKFNLTSINSIYQAGDLINIARFIPSMKVSEFVKGVITMFNLYIDDSQEDNIVKIEPLIDFYKGSDEAENWSDKLDVSKKRAIQPASNIQGKNYKFEFTEDLDYYKKLYKDSNNINYGDFNYEVKSTYQKGDKIFKVPFAQSCPVLNGALVVPTIYQKDDIGTITPYKGKARVFFNNGLKVGAFSMVISTTSNNYTSYPQAHHAYGNISNPTFDLNFGKPNEVYYPFTNYRNNNIFNDYHRLFVMELTSPESKILNAYFKLNENDIYEGMFRKLVNINGVLYRKNIIKDFDATGNETVLVELLKVVETNDPTNNNNPITVTGNISTNLQTRSVSPRNSFGQGSGVVVGGINSNLLTAVLIRG